MISDLVELLGDIHYGYKDVHRFMESKGYCLRCRIRLSLCHCKCKRCGGIYEDDECKCDSSDDDDDDKPSKDSDDDDKHSSKNEHSDGTTSAEHSPKRICTRK